MDNRKLRYSNHRFEPESLFGYRNPIQTKFKRQFAVRFVSSYPHRLVIAAVNDHFNFQKSNFIFPKIGRAAVDQSARPSF